MSQSDTNILADEAYFSHTRPDAIAFDANSADGIFGVVHDLGNLIQVATSALNMISRSPDIEMAPTLLPIFASARFRFSVQERSFSRRCALRATAMPPPSRSTSGLA
ncbi:hypothetical protein LZK76_29890 (plasmid) [Rhizobium leguminosarum]|nr:hypothetical protein LZK76_29890 [Rhizobium leguminosarum]